MLGLVLIQASLDAVALSLLKAINIGALAKLWMPLAFVVFAIQPLFFYKALAFEGLTVVNLLWDVMSGVIITIIGLTVFKEKLNNHQKVGAILALVSMILLRYK
jgi:multidrug transporter EmrE-like cation transporter